MARWVDQRLWVRRERRHTVNVEALAIGSAGVVTSASVRGWPTRQTLAAQAVTVLAGKGADMQDAELFIHVAEIAGVFVAFGALIAVRGGGAKGPVEVGFMRGMVAFGVLAMVTGLAPVALGFFDLAEHQIWASSSALVLVGFGLFLGLQVRTPEYRANLRASTTEPRTGSRLRVPGSAESGASLLYALALLLAPIIILLGVAPDLEAGLYFGTAVLILLGAAWLLLDLVYAPRPPEDTEDGLRETSVRHPGSDA